MGLAVGRRAEFRWKPGVSTTVSILRFNGLLDDALKLILKNQSDLGWLIS